MKSLTGKQLGNEIDPDGGNNHVLAAAYDLALTHAASLLTDKEQQQQILALSIDQSDMGDEEEDEDEDE